MTSGQVIALASIRGPVALAEARSALQENSEGNIQRLLKTSPEAARAFQRLFGPVAFAAAKACVLSSGTKRFLVATRPEDVDDAVWNAIARLDEVGRFLSEDTPHDTEGYAREFAKVLRRFDVAKKISNAKDFESISGILSSYRERTELSSKQAVVKLPNGWKWIDLGDHCSELEQSQMGHCGYDNRGRLYSLRDSSGNPHVTLTMDDRHQVHQIRGKGNATPDRKYWSMIKRFIDHFDADLAVSKPALGNAEADDMWARPDGVSVELDRFLYDEPESTSESRLCEVGRQNSTAMVVVSGVPGRNVCALVRSLARDRSRLIVVCQGRALSPGSFERMLRASTPDCEKRIRVVEADGDLVDMISSAERNKHYSPRHALEVFCDSSLASGFAHASTEPGLDFDPGFVSVRPINVPVDDAAAISKAVRSNDQAAEHRVLDPHLFSSSDGMAEYRDALLGGDSPIARESVSIANLVIREFLSDIAPSRELAIARLRDLLAAEVDDIDGLTYLGSGRNGSAYRSPDGFILKVTTDPIEAYSAGRLSGIDTEHLGRVYAVRSLGEGVWLLEQEDLGRLPKELCVEFDLAIEALSGIGALDCLNEGRVIEAIEIMREGLDDEVVRFVADTLRRFGVIEMCREMRLMGLMGDFHSGNIMMRGSSPVLTDLGTPGDDPREGLRRSRNRIDEFGTGTPGSGASGPAAMRGSNSSSWSNGRGALKSPANHVPEDENADEEDYALDWGPGRVSGASF